MRWRGATRPLHGGGLRLRDPSPTSGSPARQVLPDGNVRRLLMGLAMGLTAISLIYSPSGQQSGTHTNLPLQLRRPGRDTTKPAADQPLVAEAVVTRATQAHPKRQRFGSPAARRHKGGIMNRVSTL